MKDDSLVFLDRVSKIYGNGSAPVYAVREVSLDVRPGEFYSLLGSSGSGKTTTLRLIGGFEIPEYGQVYIGGEDVTTLPPYRRNVHTVFQSYALFPHLTVAENVAYSLTIANVSKAEIAPRVAEALRMFQISTLSDRRPSQLSGGQQQRVALARALINRPKVLLLDEPLSALDAKIREEVRQELRDLQRQTNLTFIYVTHDQEEALALSDRMAVMHNGQVEQVGSPSEIYDRPTSRFVAQFIGKANFLTGKVTQVDASVAVVEVNGVLIRATIPGDKPPVGETVTVMIRPERIQVNAATSLVNQTTGKTANVTYIGQLLESRFETAIGQLLVTQLGGYSSTSEAVALSWNAEDCIILPQQA
ncbi:ABC transporter ATP-binding protein [Oscillatoria sp. FACHB-1407]|uniref:ABC transporter ATP-binding protein n=1 Tax=Oscillatoria sp. FACHB-1407 TaxID=2692847 RepID=UPI00168A24C7|nr:ABC transporter ATP-binding protein [Oscillatoria sp. FACHB-1407]MBD2460349.1 ABC transporter ATP-binding protein [Oscillatoria sp. FACHB-1407]